MHSLGNFERRSSLWDKSASRTLSQATTHGRLYYQHSASDGGCRSAARSCHCSILRGEDWDAGGPWPVGFLAAMTARGRDRNFLHFGT